MIYGLLLSGAVRAAFVLALGLTAYGLLSRAAAATRRLMLVLTLGAALLVPFAAAVGLRWTVSTPEAIASLVRAPDATVSSMRGPALEPVSVGYSARLHPPGASSPGRSEVAAAIALAWLLIAAALLARVIGLHLRASALARRGTPVTGAPWMLAAGQLGAAHAAAIRASAELESPAVMGLFRSTIVVPDRALEWSLERCRIVLAHELAHVRRRDVLAQALGDVACAVHWYNPLAWVAARRLRVEREVAADDAVLAGGVRPSRYAEELLAVATSTVTPIAALAMAERPSLETRVVSILAARLARSPLGPRGTALVVALGVALTAAVACTSPSVSTVTVTAASVAPGQGSQDGLAIQRAADEEMATIASEWAPELATIVVLDPASGEILANAGRKGHEAAAVAWNVAMTPGSTVKAITVAAALETHAITVDQKFECGGAARLYGDSALRDQPSVGGSFDVAHILAVSSNIGASRIFDALGGDNLGAWLRRFHLGDAPGIAGAVPGGLPAQIVSGSYEGALIASGEGFTTTPLQMVAAYGALADEGIYHAPTLAPGGSPGERIVSPETARAMMTLLEAPVADDPATAAEARVDGVHVAGKTGTSQWSLTDGREVTYGSFIGMVDLPSRRLVILVGIAAVRDKLYGGNSAAPAFARIVKRLRGR
jgi:beta-lactamase regulating signal transducer with metallopeptidase domain